MTSNEPGTLPPDVERANQLACRRLCDSQIVLEDVRPCAHAIDGFARNLILTSGPVLPWSAYVGGQREALIGGALFERLATTREEAERKFASGEIVIGACQDYGCIGSVAGIYTASMPVFVVLNRTFGNRAYCNLYEGKTRERLNYGVYNEAVERRLTFLSQTVAPVIGAAVRVAGGVEVTPLMARALHMGDELHSRNTAASYLFADTLFPHLLALAEASEYDTSTLRDVHRFLTEDNYFFLRISMAACKATADAAHGIAYSSVVTSMAINCRTFAVRVSGLGERWFEGAHADLKDARMFDGHGADEVAWMGGESVITETVGLGGFAQAAAPALQSYQGGTAAAMVENNLAMYEITVGEHSSFRIPALNYRGTPVGIDILKVAASGVLPVIDAGLAGRDGGQIGAGVIRAPSICFERACAAFFERYGRMADPNQ